MQLMIKPEEKARDALLQTAQQWSSWILLYLFPFAAQSLQFSMYILDRRV